MFENALVRAHMLRKGDVVRFTDGDEAVVTNVVVEGETAVVVLTDLRTQTPGLVRHLPKNNPMAVTARVGGRTA